MLMARVLLGVSRDMKETDVNKNVAAFAKHHVTVTTCLAFVDTAVEMDGRVMIALMYQTLTKMAKNWNLSFMAL